MPSKYIESALLIVGDELLSGRTRDVNLYRFSGFLAEWGIPVVQAMVVRDKPDEISRAVLELLSPHRILLVTGGLGPTDDDLTVKAVSDALERPLIRSQEAERMVRSRQEFYGLGMPESALKQADIPEGAIPVMNTAGIAPGIVIQHGLSTVVCMPGVPSESLALIQPCLEASRAVRGSKEPVLFMRTWGLKENALFDRLRETARHCGVTPGYLPSPGRVDVKVKGEGAEGFVQVVKNMLGSSIYSFHRDETLEEVIGRKLVKNHMTLATAESCTGGGIGQGITSVPGSSKWYSGGVVSYSNSFKSGILGVRKETLDIHGAVSRETALEMARGVLSITGADCSVAVTGIAGPGGGSRQKPAGTVWTAAVTPAGERTDLWRLGGNREAVRNGAASRALGTLFEMLS